MYRYIYVYTVLGLARWRLHAGLQDSILIHDLLHQLLLLPTELAQLLPEGKTHEHQKRAAERTEEKTLIRQMYLILSLSV